MCFLAMSFVFCHLSFCQGHLPACMAPPCSHRQNKETIQPTSTHKYTPRWAHSIAQSAVTSLSSSNTTGHILDRRTSGLCLAQACQDDSLSCGKPNLTSMHRSSLILHKKTSPLQVEQSTSISWSLALTCKLNSSADDVNRHACAHLNRPAFENWRALDMLNISHVRWPVIMVMSVVRVCTWSTRARRRLWRLVQMIDSCIYRDSYVHCWTR